MNKETESPFGNPRFLAALAITFLSLWGWQYYMNQKYPPQKIKTAEVAAPVATTEAQEKTTQAAQPAAPPTAAAAQIAYENEHVSFSVSSSGLGFGQFTVKDYKDRSGNFIKY